MSRQTVTLYSRGPLETRTLAQRLGEKMPPGTVIAAEGDLGAGKTVFAGGLAAGLGIKDTITSPTYIFFNDYQGRLAFCHIDAYRLEGLEEEELALIGLDECFSRHKAVFCEWPQFIWPWLPPDTVRLQLLRAGDGETRRLIFSYDDQEQEWLHAVLGN